MPSKKDAIRRELEMLRQKHGELVLAEKVVEFARDPRTALHAQFTWDDTEAAHQFRLEEARRVIRVVLTVIQADTAPVRAYVSLRRDRTQPGGGYRAMDDVMTVEELRQQLLNEALDEAERWRKKYEHLRELAPVFAAMAVVREAAAKPRKRPAAKPRKRPAAAAAAR